MVAGMAGADADQLEFAASQLRAAADELDRYSTGLSVVLGSVDWLGRVAGSFLGAWGGTHRPRISTTSGFVRDAAATLERNAEAQRRASSVGGGSSGPLGAVCEVPSGFGPDLYGTKPQPTDRILAELSDFGAPDPPGWKTMTDDELEKVGIDPAMLSDSSGFEARIYRSDDGNYVLAFNGTEMTSRGDWNANIGQAAGWETAQYSQALRLAKNAQDKFGNELALTGHSLGGGLAAYASLGTDVPAVTFNAAGLSDGSYRRLGLDPDFGRSRAEDGLIRSYRVDGEILTYSQEHHIVAQHILPDAPGTKIEYQDPTEGPLPTSQHGMESMKESMDASVDFGQRAGGGGGGGGGTGR